MDLQEINRYTNTENCDLLNKKNCQFVKGNRLNIDCDTKNNSFSNEIRFYQMTQFDYEGYHSIRSYLLKYIKNNGVVLGDFKVLDQNTFKLTPKEFKKFRKVLLDNKNENIKYIIYPVFTLEFISHPTGEDMCVATSDLIN